VRDFTAGVKFLAAIALPLYVLDQATKWWIYHRFALFPSEQNLRLFPEACKRPLPLEQDIIPGWFQLVHWANTGAAFSIGSGNNVFFIVLSLATFAGLLIAWKKNVFTDRLSRWAIALLLSGILGNVTDRIVHGYVVDFLSVNLHVRFANPWPAFNVADACICTAAGLLIIAALFEKKRAGGGK
jgi:signal peptidase II